jgi:ribosomal-protein-alanine N-acetyltransferase
MSAARLIRPAHPGDAADFCRLHTTGFERPWTQAEFEGWLARADAFACVVEVNGTTAGFGLALAAGEDAEILTIVADPGLRNSGLGAALLAAMDAEAVKRSLQRWVLEVSRNNLPALALYSRQGFVEIGVRKHYYQTQEGLADALVMVRPVGPLRREGPGGQQGG